MCYLYVCVYVVKPKHGYILKPLLKYGSIAIGFVLRLVFNVQKKWKTPKQLSMSNCCFGSMKCFSKICTMLLFACGFKLYGLAEIVHTQLLMDGN